MEKSTKSAALLIGTFYIFKHRTFPAVFPLPQRETASPSREKLKANAETDNGRLSRNALQ